MKYKFLIVLTCIGLSQCALFNKKETKENIENILITAYRHNIPLIGPSNAYINAGALASTYSDLTDVARRLSEILQKGLGHNDWAKPDYNSYFSVSYNHQVARSLNLNLPDVDTVVASIKKTEQ